MNEASEINLTAEQKNFFQPNHDGSVRFGSEIPQDSLSERKLVKSSTKQTAKKSKVVLPKIKFF